MRKISFFLFLIVFGSLSRNQSIAQTPNKNYDSVLAKKLGADERGMKMYVLAILKSGTAKDLAKEARDSIFAGHMKNINRLANEGKLLTAGPLEDNAQNYAGIYVFNVATLEEGRKLVETDPAVMAKVFDFDMFLWYGTAAMMQLTPIHKSISRYTY